MDIYSNSDLEKETNKRRMSPFYMLHKEDPNKFCHHKCIIRGWFWSFDVRWASHWASFTLFFSLWHPESFLLIVYRVGSTKAAFRDAADISSRTWLDPFFHLQFATLSCDIIKIIFVFISISSSLAEIRGLLDLHSISWVWPWVQSPHEDFLMCVNRNTLC